MDVFTRAVVVFVVVVSGKLVIPVVSLVSFVNAADVLP